MTKKKIRKKKLTVDEKEEIKMEGELPKKSVIEHEERQLIGFFVVVGLVFAISLTIYFGVESQSRFEFAGVEWTIEEFDEQTSVYHARFSSFDKYSNMIYNVYLWIDPRENDVPVNGALDRFRREAVVSFTPETVECRGDFAGAVIGLGAFLKTGVGVTDISYDGRTTDVDILKGDEIYVDCFIPNDKTIVLIEIGDSSISRSDNNLDCYIIKIKDCDDIAPFEKFIIKTISASMEQ